MGGTRRRLATAPPRLPVGVRWLLLALLGAVITLVLASVLERWIRHPPVARSGAPAPVSLRAEEEEAAKQPSRRLRPPPEKGRSELVRRPQRPSLARPASTPLGLPSLLRAPGAVELPLAKLANTIAASAATFDGSVSGAPSAPELAPLRDFGEPELPSAARLLPLVAVPPVYPPRAFRAGVSGWVLLVYTVTETGGVREISVRDADPPSVFNRAAIDAARRWQYAPVLVDGQAVRVPRVWSTVTFGSPTQEQLARARQATRR